MNKMFIGLLICASLKASEYSYDLRMSFKRGIMPHDQRIEFKVNDVDVFCPCGKKPVFAMFLYGNAQYYCSSHIPEIEFVRPITKENLSDFLLTLGAANNMNGAHQG